MTLRRSKRQLARQRDKVRDLKLTQRGRLTCISKAQVVESKDKVVLLDLPRELLSYILESIPVEQLPECCRIAR